MGVSHPGRARAPPCARIRARVRRRARLERVCACACTFLYAVCRCVHVLCCGVACCRRCRRCAGGVLAVCWRCVLWRAGVCCGGWWVALGVVSYLFCCCAASLFFSSSLGGAVLGSGRIPFLPIAALYLLRRCGVVYRCGCLPLFLFFSRRCVHCAVCCGGGCMPLFFFSSGAGVWLHPSFASVCGGVPVVLASFLLAVCRACTLCTRYV